MVVGRSTEFWALLDRGDPEACWLWPRPPGTHGYGQWCDRTIGLVGSRGIICAHRAAFIYTHGQPRAKVLHRCPGRPVKLCCNPAHLYDGTDADNMADALRYGELPLGSARRTAVLTEDQVLRAVRLLDEGMSQAQVGRMLGVSHGTVGHIARGSTWSWLTGRGR